MSQPRRNHHAHQVFALLIGGVLTFALAVPSTALEQIVLTQSSITARSAENFLDEANPTTVDSDQLQVESSDDANRRALILFDFSLLPNVGIKSATLKLTVNTAPNILAGTRDYDLYPLINLFTQSAATWDKRVADLSWDTDGGDMSGTRTATTTMAAGDTSASWTVTTDVQSWYSGNADGVPVPNYGELIRDRTESSNPLEGATTIFDASTSADPPTLTVQFVQNVANLTATAGNAQVTLNWSYPAAIGTVVDKTTGVLILRGSTAGEPVNKGTVPVDGTTYALCAAIPNGNGIVVFNNTALVTTFTDNSSDTCGAPANGTTYYYKVFTQDSIHDYSASGTSADGGSLSVPEASATPSATGPYSTDWMTATYSTTLAPPSLFPELVAMVGTGTDFLFGINTNPSAAAPAFVGSRLYPPVSLAGAVDGRSPIVETSESLLDENMVYVADQAGLAYGINAETGEPVWTVDPLNDAGAAPFLAAGGLLLKDFASSLYTLSEDLLILGTDDTNTATGNSIVAVNADTGATVWTDTGGVGSIPKMDIISSTPAISYTRNTVWFTSASNDNAQPSVWELNANTGAVLATLSLGDISSSPVLTPDESTVFVGTNAGTIYAINAATATVITSIAGGDGEIVTYPVVVGFSSPYTVLFSGTDDVHSLTYNSSTQAFTANWETAITTPSAPIGVFGQTDLYVGGGDGKIHMLNLSTGADVADFDANTGQPGVVGDPSLDLDLNEIYVSTTDQRMYSFPIPF